MQRFKKILVYHNTHTGDRSALNRALQLAESNQARLRIVDVMQDAIFPTMDPTLRA